MKKAGYTLYSKTTLLYTFVSSGKRGEILKGIFFEEIETSIYNVALVDFDEQNEKWSDDTVSDNGDIVKIMSTVVHAISDFIERNPSSVIYFKGNTKIRQKLYVRIINNYYSELSEFYTIIGEIDDAQEIAEFGKQYASFYIYKKQ